MALRPLGLSSFRWVFYLTAGLPFRATGLRSLLVYANGAALPRALGPVLLSLLLFIVSENSVAARWSAVFPLYVLSQTTLVLPLLYSSSYDLRRTHSSARRRDTLRGSESQDTSFPRCARGPIALCCRRTQVRVYDTGKERRKWEHRQPSAAIISTGYA